MFNGFLTENAKFYEKLPLGPTITILKEKVYLDKFKGHFWACKDIPRLM